MNPVFNAFLENLDRTEFNSLFSGAFAAIMEIDVNTGLLRKLGILCQMMTFQEVSYFYYCVDTNFCNTFIFSCVRRRRSTGARHAIGHARLLSDFRSTKKV